MLTTENYSTLFQIAIDEQLANPNLPKLPECFTPSDLISYLNENIPVIKKGREEYQKWGYAEFARVLSQFEPSLFLYDFDMTLGYTRRLYSKAEQYCVNLLLKELGIDREYSYQIAKEVHDLHIHQSVDGIHPGHLRRAGLISTPPNNELTEEEKNILNRFNEISSFAILKLHEEINSFPKIFDTPYRKMFAASPDDKILVERINYAFRLVQTTDAFNMPQKILTNSKRIMPEVLIPMMGYDSILSPDLENLICFGDVHGFEDEKFTVPSKSCPEYWDFVLRNVDRASVIIFEDNPHAARWALEYGKVGLVICRNERNLVHVQDFSELKREYPNRLLVVSEWKDLESEEKLLELEQMIGSQKRH